MKWQKGEEIAKLLCDIAFREKAINATLATDGQTMAKYARTHGAFLYLIVISMDKRPGELHFGCAL
jgi:hypothetical protein